MRSVDPADGQLDLISQQAVLLDPLPARARYQHEHCPSRVEAAFAEQLTVGPEPMDYALGVVKAVDTEQHNLGLPQGLPDLPGRARTPSRRAICSSAAESIEIGNAAGTRAGRSQRAFTLQPGSPTRSA
jgi:hypothetical protein